MPRSPAALRHHHDAEEVVQDVFSVGAINGAVVATDPTLEKVESLGAVWRGIASDDTFGASLLGRLSTLARSRIHVHSNAFRTRRH